MTTDETIVSIEALGDGVFYTFTHPIGTLPDGEVSDLKRLAAELKLYREFVGAVNSFGSENGYGFYQVMGAGRIFTIYAGDDSELVATGTDPFDAYCNLRNQELSEVESGDA